MTETTSGGVLRASAPGEPNWPTWNVCEWFRVHPEEAAKLAEAIGGGGWRFARAFCHRLWPAGRTPTGDRLLECDWQVVAATFGARKAAP